MYSLSGECIKDPALVRSRVQATTVSDSPPTLHGSLASGCGARTSVVNCSCGTGLRVLGQGVGDVLVGASGTGDFKMVKVGKIAMTITKTKAPPGVFSLSASTSEGQSIPPGGSAFRSVTFTLTAHRYKVAGGVVGNPSYPVTDEYAGSVGRESDFCGVHLVWDPKTRSIVHYK